MQPTLDTAQLLYGSRSPRQERTRLAIVRTVVRTLEYVLYLSGRHWRASCWVLGQVASCKLQLNE
jgi:hypothetical protein